MGPEVLQGRGYDEKADVWSLGTILFQMLTGERPFNGRDIRDLNEKIRTSVYGIPRNLIVSQNLISFLSSCLRIDSAKRLNYSELESHPFLNKRQISMR